MNWSPKQDEALKAVDTWVKSDSPQVFRLFGYAGTGKTELAKHLAEGIKGTVLFGAYTGKAAHVMKTRGCPGATTIHSLIYNAKEKGRARLSELEAALADQVSDMISEGPQFETEEARQKYIDSDIKVKNFRTLIAQERKNLAQPAFSLNLDSPVRNAKLVVIDECSMVDGRMGEDLLYFDTKILVIGDPAQLPPIMGSGFFTEGVEPDIMLEEIHRQAADNPIIALATKTRQQERLPLGTYGDSKVVTGRISEDQALGADQILVGRNATRRASNNRIRHLLGRTEELPVNGDRLVCLRNNHDVGLLNGTIWHVADVGEYGDDRMVMSVLSDDDNWPLEVEAHTYPFRADPNAEKPGWFERKEAEEFDYGYALTVHKAQGSQWDNVLLFDESFCFRKDRWRWLYTGITRAAKKVTVIDM